MTRTISCNQPTAARPHPEAPSRAVDRPGPSAAAEPQPHPHPQEPCEERAPQQTRERRAPQEACEERGPQETRERRAPQEACEERGPQETRERRAPQEVCEGRGPQETRERRAPRKPLPAVPRPACNVPALFRAATDLLADLHRHEPRLLLSTGDAAHLAPGVAAWLERDVTPAAVRRALTADLPPEGVRRPAAFLAHRLAAQLPPPPPFRASAAPPAVRHPLQNCDGCDRAFRAPHPGRCRACRTGLQEAA